MLTVITVARELTQIKELLKGEAQIVKQIQTEDLISLCLEIDVPFELSQEEQVKFITRVLCKGGRYKEVPLVSKEKIIVVGDFLKAGQAIYLAKKSKA